MVLVEQVVLVVEDILRVIEIECVGAKSFVIVGFGCCVGFDSRLLILGIGIKSVAWELWVWMVVRGKDVETEGGAYIDSGTSCRCRKP